MMYRDENEEGLQLRNPIRSTDLEISAKSQIKNYSLGINVLY